MRWWRRTQSWFLTLRAASHRHFGNLYGDRESHENAIADLTRALQRDAGNVDALVMRGTLYWRELNDTERAIRDLSQALELDHTRWDALLTRGLARQEAGDLNGALADLAAYLDHAPHDAGRPAVERLYKELTTLPFAPPRGLPPTHP